MGFSRSKCPFSVALVRGQVCANYGSSFLTDLWVRSFLPPEQTSNVFRVAPFFVFNMASPMHLSMHVVAFWAAQRRALRCLAPMCSRVTIRHLSATTPTREGGGPGRRSSKGEACYLLAVALEAFVDIGSSARREEFFA